MMATQPQNCAAGFKDLHAYLEQQISAQDIDVPLMPEVARKVMELLQTPDADAVRLAKLIQGDQSLAAHVMRVANSAAYSPSFSLVSLQQAIARLGINLIGEIALSVSLNSKVFNVRGFENHVLQIWQHALATALWCKEISRQCRKNVEATFLCGLLHSIGRPVVLQMIVDAANKLGVVPDNDTVIELENQLHLKVGNIILTQWQMPAIIVEASHYFEDYQAAPQFAEQAATVNAAERLARHTLTPDSISQEELYVDPALAYLNLYPDDVRQVLAMQQAVENSMETLSG